MGLKLELFETIYDRIANSSELNRVCDFDSKERKQIARTVLKFFKSVRRQQKYPASAKVPTRGYIGVPYIRSSNFLEPPYIINSCGKNHVKRYLIELDELNKNMLSLKYLERWALSY